MPMDYDGFEFQATMRRRAWQSAHAMLWGLDLMLVGANLKLYAANQRSNLSDALPAFEMEINTLLQKPSSQSLAVAHESVQTWKKAFERTEEYDVAGNYAAGFGFAMVMGGLTGIILFDAKNKK